MAANKSVTDLIGAAHGMPVFTSAQLYADTAAQVCKRSLKQLFNDVEPLYFHEDPVILDIGCGTGETTLCLLDQFNPRQVIGVDVCQEFVDYAEEENHNSNITYMRMNVETEWPQRWTNMFTTVFSNYAGHWIKDHPALLTRIGHCVKQNGDLIMQFFHSPLPNDDEMKAARRAAQECGIEQVMMSALQSVKKQMPVWKDAHAYARLVTSMGFTVKTCKIKELHFKCQSKFERAGMTATVSPFMLHVPTEKRLLFATKYVNNLRDPLTINHKALILHAVKN